MKTIDRPVFIIGAPRSGTTVVYKTLQRSPHLYSIYTESNIWNELSSTAWGERGALVTVQDYSEDIHNKVQSFFLTHMRNEEGNGTSGNNVRFIEKTPTTCLKIGLIRRMYPDAYFIYITRDARNTIHSMLEVWDKDEKWFPKDQIPDYLDASLAMPDGHIERRTWGPLPPGWRKYRNGQMVALHAYQWSELNRYAFEALRQVPERTYRLNYENLSYEPERYIRECCAFMQIPFDHTLQEALTEIAPTKPNTWQSKYKKDIQSVTPIIQDMMNKLGYSLA